MLRTAFACWSDGNGVGKAEAHPASTLMSSNADEMRLIVREC